MSEEPQAGSGQDFSQAGLQECRGTLGMGTSKTSFPGASWLSMGMAESSWEMEKKAREKIIPGEMCSAPAVGLSVPRGMDTALHPLPIHARGQCTSSFSSEVLREDLSHQPLWLYPCWRGSQSRVPQATHPVWPPSNGLSSFPAQLPQCSAGACRGRLLGWRALPWAEPGESPLALLTHSCHPTVPTDWAAQPSPACLLPWGSAIRAGMNLPLGEALPDAISLCPCWGSC